MRNAWDLAQLTLLLVQVDPLGLGGVWLKAGYGPVRQSWLSQLQSLGLSIQRMPHHIDNERLLGGIDFSATLAQGHLVEQTGLLAQADQGLLVMAMAEKLSAQTLAMLLQAHDQGEIQGLTLGQTHSSRFGMVALDESSPDEPGVAHKLKERLGIWLDIDAVDLAQSKDTIEHLTPEELRRVRSRLSAIEPRQEHIHTLCEVAWALGVDSLRAPLLALRVACAHAAIHERTVLEQDDLGVAAQMVFSPRATRMPSNASNEEEQAPAQNPESNEEHPKEPQDDSTPNDSNEDQPSSPPNPQSEALEDTVLAAALANLPPKLLDQLLLGANQSRQQPSSGNSGQAKMSKQRGRPLSPRQGRPSAGARLHLLATLRAAAPKQKIRKKHPGQTISIRSEDFFIQRFAHKSASCIIVAMDASGSAALARLAEAKGAVEILLQQSYARRDSVCVIAFRGSQCQTLLPATRSLVRAKKALAGLPGGGGTPIAKALKHASDQAQSLNRQGITPILVMMSDGKANVTLQGLGGRQQAQMDAMQCAKHWATLGFAALWIDTSLQPTGHAQELASLMNARYLPMPYMASERMANAMKFVAKN